MAVDQDRMKASLFSLVRAAQPRLAYAAPRFARVVKAHPADGATTALDVVPEDPAFPSMAQIPLFLGSAGHALKLGVIKPGTRVLVEFSAADPSQPFVRSWAGGENVEEFTISADTVNLGGDAGTEPTLMGETYRAAEQTMNAGPAGLAATFTSMAGACTGPLAPLGAGFTALAAAVTAFEGQAAEFLTTNAKVK